MLEGRYHATTQNRFYPVMSNVNKNITVETKLISPPTNINIKDTLRKRLLLCYLTSIIKENN
jgi:hypothetical protein